MRENLRLGLAHSCSKRWGVRGAQGLVVLATLGPVPALGQSGPPPEPRAAPQPESRSEQEPQPRGPSDPGGPPAAPSVTPDSDAAEGAQSGAAEAPAALAPQDRITAPEPLNTPVQAVPGITERVEIVLELVVDELGHVSTARARGGEEPFATLAVEATGAWTFRPATKGGVAQPSKVAYLVSFDPAPPARPAEVLPTDNPARSQVVVAPRAVATASAMPIQEVLILGDLPEPGSRGFTRYESQRLPGAFGDPLRSIEVLPGVSPILTGLPLFFVRGGPPGNVGFFIDGIRIPQLYHGFLGPSVVHPEFINRVDLHAGPMPVQFGRYAGAALSAELAEPQGELRGQGSIRLLDAGGFGEAPFAGGRGYALIGGRYSYTGLLLSAIAPQQRLDYWDYQGLFGYRLTKKDELSLFAFGSYDFAGSGDRLAGTEFHRVDVRYRHEFSNRSQIRLAFTTGADRSRSDVGFLRDIVFAGRANYEARHDDVVVRAGADVIVDDYDMYVSPTVPEPEVYEELFPPRTDVAGGAYVDLVLFPRGVVQVIPGIRADLFNSMGETALSADPRVAAEYQLTDWLSAVHSVGLAHQAPSFIPNVPGAQVAGLRGGLQESVQAATTYEMKLPWELSLSVGGYANVTTNLSDPIGASQSLAVDETSADQRVLGRGLGLEVYLKRPLSRRLGGLVSYTFATSLRSSEYISTLAGYDRPHVLNLVVGYNLGKHWEASGKLAIASGIPGRYTTLDGFVFEDDRSPPLTRLDLKLQKRWYPSEHFNWGMQFEVLNATYSGSVSRRICGVRGCRDEGTAPIVIPNVGFDFAWR